MKQIAQNEISRKEKERNIFHPTGHLRLLSHLIAFPQRKRSTIIDSNASRETGHPNLYLWTAMGYNALCEVPFLICFSTVVSGIDIVRYFKFNSDLFVVKYLWNSSNSNPQAPLNRGMRYLKILLLIEFGQKLPTMSVFWSNSYHSGVLVTSFFVPSNAVPSCSGIPRQNFTLYQAPGAMLGWLPQQQRNCSARMQLL